MPDIVKNPISEVFKQWRSVVEPVVGKGNISQDMSQTIASTKKMYARLYMLGNPGGRWDLEGDECATNPSFQAESFATDPKGTEKAYEIDEVSHQVMTDLGFRRSYGPELISNTDSKIKRVVSRYTRLYTGQI